MGLGGRNVGDKQDTETRSEKEKGERGEERAVQADVGVDESAGWLSASQMAWTGSATPARELAGLT